MTFSWADLVFIVAIVVAGGAIGHALAMRRLRHQMAKSHSEMNRRLQALTEAFSMAEPGLPENLDAIDAPEEIATEPALPLPSRPLPRIALKTEPAQKESEDIAPEMRAAVAAAVFAAVGRQARILSMRRVPSRGTVSPWTQQGRVLVQSSHNLPLRER